VKTLILDTNAYNRYTAGELRYGFRLGTREHENLALLRKFLGGAKSRILDGTETTSEYFGMLKAQLKKNGTPIPLNDVWIAAQALETGSVLVTFDPHFQAVPGLRIWTA